MSGIVRLVTILGKIYIGIGSGIGVWSSKQTLDYYITYSYEPPIGKTLDRIQAILCGSVDGILWPVTLYDKYSRMQKSRNVANP